MRPFEVGLIATAIAIAGPMVGGLLAVADPNMATAGIVFACATGGVGLLLLNVALMAWAVKMGVNAAENR